MHSGSASSRQTGRCGARGSIVGLRWATHSHALVFFDRLYCLLRLIDGDQESRRVKFIGLTFVGEDVGGMQRGRVAAHKGSIFALCGVSSGVVLQSALCVSN